MKYKVRVFYSHFFFQTAMDQLHMHFTSAIHNTAFTIVLGYVELCSGTTNSNFHKRQYTDLCKVMSFIYDFNIFPLIFTHGNIYYQVTSLIWNKIIVDFWRDIILTSLTSSWQISDKHTTVDMFHSKKWFSHCISHIRRHLRCNIMRNPKLRNNDIYVLSYKSDNEARLIENFNCKK